MKKTNEVFQEFLIVSCDLAHSLLEKDFLSNEEENFLEVLDDMIEVFMPQLQKLPLKKFN